MIVLGSMEFPMVMPPPFNDVDTGCDIASMPDLAASSETAWNDEMVHTMQAR